MSDSYAFCCKTLFDPSKGLSLSILKDQYVHQAPIKVMTIVTEHDGQLIFKHGYGDGGATELVNMLTDLSPAAMVSHTDFHANAVRARTNLTLPGKLLLIDDLARRENPALRSVALAKLIDVYVGNGAQRRPCDFIEGHHTIEALTEANLRDCLLIYTIYRTLARRLRMEN